MKTSQSVIIALCLLVVCASAVPMYRHKKGFGPPIMPVPFHPYPMYGPQRRNGFNNGLTLLTSAALLGSGNPFGQALGGVGLFSLL